MIATLQKCANSKKIKILKQFIKGLSLKGRLEEFYDKPISKIKKMEVEEIDTGSPVGEEIW